MKHYFLYCPCFAALREKLFTSAAQLLGNRKIIINRLLKGISTADFLINVRLFQLVQSFICYQIACVSYRVCVFLFVFSFYSFAFFVCVCSILTCICILNVNSVSSVDESKPLRLLEQMLQ